MKGTKENKLPQAKPARREGIQQQMQYYGFSPHRNISVSIPSTWVSAGIGKEGAEERSITLCPKHLCPSFHGTVERLGFSFVSQYRLALGDLAVYQKSIALCNCTRSKMRSVISLPFICHLTLTLQSDFSLRKHKFGQSYSPYKCKSETQSTCRYEGTKFLSLWKTFLALSLTVTQHCDLLYS